MAGLIDVGIIKPELAGAFGAGYAQSGQERQQREINQFKLDQLKQDRAALTDLQSKLRAAGQSDDPKVFFRALIETGNPDYMSKGYDGLQRYNELQRADALLRREAPELFGPAATVPAAPAAAAPGAAAPMVPSAAPAPAPTALFNEAALSSLSPMTQDNIRAQYDMSKDLRSKGQTRQAEFLEDRAALMMANDLLKSQGAGFPIATQEQIAAARDALRVPAPAAAPVNTLAPAAPAATNAMIPGAVVPAVPVGAVAAQPGAAAPAESVNAMIPAGTPDARIRELRSKILTLRSVSDPRLKSLADVYEAELKELTKPVTLSPGQQLLSGGRVIYTAPAAPVAPRIDIIGVAKGTDMPVYFDKDSRQQFTVGVDASGKQVAVPYTGAVNRSTSNVTATATAAGSRLESAEQKGQGELNIKSFGEIRDAARLATRTLPALETQTKILDQGFTTGFGTEVQKAAASVLAALGVEKAENFATNAQTFLAATQQAVLQKQLEQKGTQTAADAERITQTGAQLGNTVRGNRFIIDVAREQLKRDIEQRDFYANWWANKKTYEGAENAWYAGEGGKSLFDRPALKKYLVPDAAQTDKRKQGLDAIFGR